MASDLVVQFGDILQKPTIFPDEQGKINVVVKNQGDTSVNGPVNLKLYASTDNQLDTNNLNTLGSPTGERGAKDLLRGTDELLGSLNGQTVNLAPGQSQTITIDFAGSQFRTPSVVSPGAYYLFAQVEPGSNVTDSNSNNNTGSQLITQGDVVIQWNSILLNTIQASGKGSDPGTPPPLAARNQAIVHAAIYDAVNSFDRVNNQGHNPYLVDIKPPAGASKEAAAVGAAYQTVSQLFTNENLNRNLSPERRASIRDELNRQRDRSLNEIKDSSAAEQAGFNFGVDIANRIIEARKNDGSATAQGPYTPGNGIGDWKPTFTDGETTNNDTNLKPAALPQWGSVTPFAIPSASQFRPDSFPQYNSPRYAREFNDVKAKGAENSTVRSANETEIAQFWTYDRDDTFRPSGQLNEVAQELSLAQGKSLSDNARLFALLNIAQADAGIVAWDAKYTYEQLRPITAIREADKDNNPDTVADPNWEPLLDTPPFPDYISGHSVFGGAAAQVLANFFGDNTSFNIPSQELPGVARSYGSLSQLAQEDADSRLYGGVHINAATVDGVEVGQNVANYVLGNVLK